MDGDRLKGSWQPFRWFWCQRCQILGQKEHEPLLCRPDVSSSDTGSLFASVFVLISLDKLCVPCSSERSARLLQRDGLFKAAQVADREEWNEIYDVCWELTRGDHRFAPTLGRIPATSKLQRPDLLSRPVTSCWSLPQPIDGELSNASRSLSALRLLNYAAQLRPTPDHSRVDAPITSCALLVQDGPSFVFLIKSFSSSADSYDFMLDFFFFLTPGQQVHCFEKTITEGRKLGWTQRFPRRWATDSPCLVSTAPINSFSTN